MQVGLAASGLQGGSGFCAESALAAKDELQAGGGIESE
jgi:hypothetical protein